MQSIDVPAQTLADAITELGTETGLRVAANANTVTGMRSAPVSGAMTPMEALQALLDGTGLAARPAGANGAVVALNFTGGVEVTQSAQAPVVLDEIILETSRTRTPIDRVPRGAFVLDERTVEEANRKSTNFAATLPETIPGFGTPVYQNATRGLLLRGREPLYLIDGVPVFDRQFGTQFQYFDSRSIEEIEVLYGPTALYGEGAAGGIIQFFTKSPTEDLTFGLTTSVTTALGDGTFLEDQGLTYRLTGEVSDTIGRLGYVGVLTLERHGASFQPDGQRIAPTRLDDYDDVNFFGKLTYDIDAAQRVEGWLSWGRSRANETDFDTVAGDVDVEAGETAVARFDPVRYAREPEQEGLFFSTRYVNEDLAGGRFSLQGYYSDQELTQRFSDIRGPGFPEGFPQLFQTSNDTEAYGVRTDYAFDMGSRLSLNLGADYRHEDVAVPLIINDVATFESTDPNFLNGAVIGQQGAPYTLDAYGLFVQGEFEATPRLTLSGGVRYDRFSYDVPAYNPSFAPGDRPGGSGSDDGFSFNVGAAYDVNNQTTVFASFAQGFSLPEISFGAAFGVAPGVALDTSAFVEPIVVDNYEVGVRGSVGVVDYSFAAFYAESDLGSSITVNRDTGAAEVNRAPQRNYGFEFAARAAVSSDVDLSLGVSWNDGENDLDDDGDFDPLQSINVLPFKVSLRGDWQATDRLALNGTIFYLGDRDRAFDDGIDNYEAEGYVTADVGLTYEIGQGTLSAQVTNLFNEEYLPLESQSRFGNTADRRFAGPGRELTVGYNIQF